MHIKGREDWTDLAPKKNRLRAFVVTVLNFQSRKT